MALTPRDRDLLKRCLHHEPGAWNDFVDRFLGLVFHIVHHTADLRSFPLQPEDAEDIVAQVLLKIIDNDYAVLRQFRGNSSLATYLTVIARRNCIGELVRRAPNKEFAGRGNDEPEAPDASPSKRMETFDEVAQMLKKLPERDQSIVKMYFLEGRSYEEISKELSIPMNSIGPILSRARRKMQSGED